MTKRRIAQIVTVAIAAFAAVCIVAITNGVSAMTAARDLEYSYRRAFGELSTAVSTMESTLEKAHYANTATQQSGIAARLMEQSNSAKASLAVLPLKEDSMDNVQKFLTQVEDFSAAVNKKVAAKESLSNDDREATKHLYDYAALLKADLMQLQQQFDGEHLTIGESRDKISNLDLNQDVPTFSDSLAKHGEDFQDYPTLIYDGPFSDHISQQKPKLIEHETEISTTEAIERAAKFFDLPPSKVTHRSDSNGRLPCYVLSNGTKRISVTKQGGVVLSMLDTREIKSSALSYEDAKQKAVEFLQKNGFGELTESYYVINDNQCTIQFFTKESDTTIYPDLIKVSVALDNGEISEYNATGYVMNHHKRTIGKPKLSAEKARENVSPELTIEKEKLAIIPTAGNHEVLCYEFLCRGKNGDEVLVYLNGKTGMEEQILILLRNDNGVLTM